jgi:hypothetical protein
MEPSPRAVDAPGESDTRGQAALCVNSTADRALTVYFAYARTVLIIGTLL